jgi:hypothetical protein
MKMTAMSDSVALSIDATDGQSFSKLIGFTGLAHRMNRLEHNSINIR